MRNAHDTVQAYFDALVVGDAETLIAMMLFRLILRQDRH